MSEDPIRRYSDATKEFEQAFAKIHELAGIISEIGARLGTKPHVFMISNVSIGFPMELSVARGVFTLDANKWPSAKNIAEAIVDLQNKRDALKEVWRNLSETDKKLVSPPDTRE